jgi:nitric oxide reductase subunit C
MTILILAYASYSGAVYWIPITQSNADDQILRGKEIWQQKNCNACHQLYGLGGFLGPDLTNVFSHKGKGPDYIKAFVSGGTATMPAFDLSNQEMESLIAFLQHVDSSGKSDPRKFKITGHGTIESE